MWTIQVGGGGASMLVGIKQPGLPTGQVRLAAGVRAVDGAGGQDSLDGRLMLGNPPDVLALLARGGQEINRIPNGTGILDSEAENYDLNE